MNVILALKEILLESSSVTALAGQNIYDYELPELVDDVMAQKSVVIQPAGGPGGPAQLAIQNPRITVRCYGETSSLAAQLDNAVYEVLKFLPPTVAKNTYIHGCIPSVAGITLRDPDLRWPYSVSSYIVRASDLTVT